ncbi:MAG: LysR family transcriptional regulator [Actinomycetota bacterium]
MMSDRPPAPRLDDVATFVRVVDMGSFSAAAASMFVPRSSVSRQVARLETHLGVRLMHRTTRRSQLTEAGQKLYTDVAGAMAAIERAASVASDDVATPSGTVRVSAPPDVGAELLPDLLADFVSDHSSIHVEVELTSGFPDMLRTGLDLSIRNGEPDDAGLTATKLQDTTFGLYASSRYLTTAPALTSVDDLRDHDCLLHHGHRGESHWNVSEGGSGLRSITVTGRISATDLAFIRRACVAGAGVALLPTLVGDIEADTGTLLRILPDVMARGIPLYLVRPSTRFVPRRIELLESHLLEKFPQ